MSEVKLDPLRDGVDHINIYTKSRTVLGRLLSNMSLSYFNHDEYGRFASMEGFYYWLATGKQHDDLRQLYGFNAKRVGREYSKVLMDINEFHDELRAALWFKYRDYPAIGELFHTSPTSPFVHYYYYGSMDTMGHAPPKVVVPKGNEWLTDEWERIRTHHLELALERNQHNE